jgi:DNA invertase Pin-like site-specific DNA recombinase
MTATTKRPGRRDRLPRWFPTGSDNPAAILNEADVRLLRQRLRGGESRAALAREFNITPRTVRSVAERTRWAHIAD